MAEGDNETTGEALRHRGAREQGVYGHEEWKVMMNPSVKFWLIQPSRNLYGRRYIPMVKAPNMFVAREQRRIDRCHRCGGMMVQEKVFELGSFDWHCVSCGERVDPVILAHREACRSSQHLVREEAEKLLSGHGASRLN